MHDLPHHLVEAFKATLEEVVEADILLHLIDISHPKAKEQAEAVYKTLEGLGVKDKEVIPVLNKIDKVGDEASIERARSEFSSPIAISAAKRQGLDSLVGRIESYAERSMVDIKITLPASDMKTVNLIYENGVVETREYKGDKVYITARVPARLKSLLVF